MVIFIFLAAAARRSLGLVSQGTFIKGEGRSAATPSFELKMLVFNFPSHQLLLERRTAAKRDDVRRWSRPALLCALEEGEEDTRRGEEGREGHSDGRRFAGRLPINTLSTEAEEGKVP